MPHAIGSDSQCPFAIAIVGGLVVNPAVSILLPPLCVWLAREGERLPKPEEEFESYISARRFFVILL